MAGVSERRIRQLIGRGTLQATRFGRSWAIDATAEARTPATSRPLANRTASLLQLALDSDSLAGFTGNDRARTARLIRKLRTSDTPGVLLRSWTHAYTPTGNKTGALLIRLAHEGDDQQIMRLLSYPRRRFLNTPERLARVVRDERTIYGLSIDDLASSASVPRGDVRALEAGRWSDVGVGAARRVLRTLNQLPSVLPPRTAVPA